MKKGVKMFEKRKLRGVRRQGAEEDEENEE